jgi:hypothetical protein
MSKLEELDILIYALFITSANPIRSDSVELNSVEAEEVRLPPKYKAYADIFSESEAIKFPDFTRVKHFILIKEGVEVSFSPIYSLSATELEVLRAYIESSLEKGWIRHSESSAGALILFILKKDGGLRLYVDYRGLNRVTIKNRHPLPLILETLDRLNSAKRFIRLDLRDAYPQIRIKRGDEWKITFRSRYSHFEYISYALRLNERPYVFLGVY